MGMNFRIADTVRNWWTSGENDPTRIWLVSILWLGAISWLAFLWHLGSVGLVDETEPLFAEAARQMTVTGDWITPYFNGETRFDKPPLIYWLMAIAYKLIGVNEWAVRLPSAMAAIALMLLSFYTLRYFGISRPGDVSVKETQVQSKTVAHIPQISLRLLVPLSLRQSQLTTDNYTHLESQRWLSAWIGAALIAFNPITIIWARTGVSDMLLSSCMGSALLAFFLGYAQGENFADPQFSGANVETDKGTRGEGDGEKIKVRGYDSKGTPTQKMLSFPSGWYLVFYVLIALAILAKGPVGIVVPGLIIGSFLLYVGNLGQVWREMRVLMGLVIILALAVPWYVLVTLANGEDYIESFFGYHNFERFTGVVNHHWAPWYFYFLVVLVGFAPWSSYLPIAIARLRIGNRQRWQASPRFSQLGLFAWFWFAGIFGFFTIAVTKLPSYVLPLMPAAAILVALLWSDQITHRVQGKNYLSLFIISAGLNVILVVAIAGAMLYSPKLVGYDPAALDLSFRLQQSGLPLLGGIIWGITAIATVITICKRPWRSWTWTVNLVGFVAFIIFVVTPASFLLDQARQFPLRQLSIIAAQVEQPGEELIMVGFEKPSVVFYSQRLVNFFDTNYEAIDHIQKISTNSPQPPSILILIESKRFNKIKDKYLKPNEYKNLGSAGSYQLLRITKQVIAQNFPLQN